MRLALAALLALTIPAAAWEVAPYGAIEAAPRDGNGMIVAITLRCRRDVSIGVVTPGRRLRPKRDLAEEDALFDTLFDKAAAEIDGEIFPLGVGGGRGEFTVNLWTQDVPGLLGALADGTTLTLRFDILPENAKDGAGLETFATFDLDGYRAAIENAGPACATS